MAIRPRIRDWFFVLSNTKTAPDGTEKKFEMRAGGRPAMICVMGLGLLGIEFLAMAVLNPPLPMWLNAVSLFVLLILFAVLCGWQIYLAERHEDNSQQPEED